MFDNIMQGIVNALCEYGVWSAGLFSGHGMYEEKVPQDLIAMNENNEKQLNTTTPAPAIRP